MSRQARIVSTLLGLAFVSAASLVQSAPIVTISPTGPWPNGAAPGGNDLYVFNIDPDGTVFDTIDITFEASTGSFAGENVPAVVEFTPAGTSANTDVLGLNTVALGWSILVGADTPTLFNAAGGPLGQDIVAPVDFAQIVPSGFLYRINWTINFADNGVLVGSQSGIIPVPEPSTAMLALFGLCFFGKHRR